MSQRRVASLCALFGLSLALLPPSRSVGQTLRGSIRDSTTNRPVASARVTLLDSYGDTVATDVSRRDGTFVVSAKDWGAFIVSIVRLGYRPFIAPYVRLLPADTLEVVYEMSPLAIAMDPVVVQAEAAVQYAHVRYLQKEGFYHRERATTGRHLDPVAVEKRSYFAHRFTDFMVGLPHVRVDYGFLAGSGRVLKLKCGRPRFFIDDIPLIADVPIDEAVDAMDVLAIEIYDSAGSAPARYGACSVVIWTRHRASAQMRP